MSQRILLICPSGPSSAVLSNCLLTNGYVMELAQELSNPAHMTHPPALCIVNLQVQNDLPDEVWGAWLRACQSTQTACLVFDPEKTPDPAALNLLEPLGEILTRPSDTVELLARVKSLLTIRKLLRQLETTRQQLVAHQDELQEALDSAAHIQRSMIPALRPTYQNLKFAWQFLPYKKVGGDLFNIAQLDEQTAMVYLVDVSGHGISSAMVTVSVHQSLSMHTGQIIKRPLETPPFYAISTPGEVLRRLEQEYPFERFEEFFTISYALLNPYTGTLHYANAGHPPPLLLRQDGTVERLDEGGTIIGIGESLEFQEGEHQLAEGDRLFFYTDGITEHLNSFGQIFGEQRLVECLRDVAECDLEEACRRIIKTVQQHGGDNLGQDDITLIAAEFAPRTEQEIAT